MLQGLWLQLLVVHVAEWLQPYVEHVVVWLLQLSLHVDECLQALVEQLPVPTSLQPLVGHAPTLVHPLALQGLWVHPLVVHVAVWLHPLVAQLL